MATKTPFNSDEQLVLRMQELGIFEKDLKESFVRASGPGGQNVNKVATCVVLKHIPTEITVKCQQERTQGANRKVARELLVAEIEHLRAKALRQEIYEREKERRQKRRLSKKSKEAILEQKRRHSEKKKSRGRVHLQQIDDF